MAYASFFSNHFNRFFSRIKRIKPCSLSFVILLFIPVLFFFEPSSALSGWNKIIFPSDEGITLIKGQTYTIKWEIVNLDYVPIMLLSDDDDEIVLIIATKYQNTGSYTWTVPKSLPNGSNYYIEVGVAGYSVAQSEYNFSINDTSQILYPDLTVSSANYSPTSPKTFDDISYKVTIKNQGKATAEDIQVVVYLDGDIFDNHYLTDLLPGESDSFESFETMNLSAGTHTIWIGIDPDNDILESNETNNTYNLVINVGAAAKPDLIVSSINWTPTSPKSVDNVLLQFTANNQGDAASGSCAYTVTVDGLLKANGTLPGIAAKGQTTISNLNLGPIPQGSHTIWVIADSGGVVNETNETNNGLSKSISIQGGWFNTKITGLIKDAQTQKPINGIIVQLDGGALQTNTNAKGEFAIYGASTGNHKLQVWGFAYNFQEFNINVFGDKDTPISTILLSKLNGTVFGRLVDSQTGEPLAAATAQLDGGGKWRTLTDEQGYFMFLGVTSGAHTLQAWGYAYNFQEQAITVNATGATDVGNRYFSIVPNTIRGQIVDAGTNRPIMNAHVQFDGGGLGKETKTNISGRFILVNIPAGARQLQTWGWAYQFKQTAVTQNSGAATDAGKIGISPIGGTVNGRLLDAVNGLPVYNAVAQLDGGNYAPWLTNSLLNGDFIMYNVTGGNHLFQTWGYAYRFYQKNITATSGGNLNLGDVLLTPDPNTFNGRALDAGTRLPISGATVILTGNGQNITTTSFPDGRFVLLNVPQGIYDITVDDATHSLVHIKAAHPGNNINVDIGDALLP